MLARTDSVSGRQLSKTAHDFPPQCCSPTFAVVEIRADFAVLGWRDGCKPMGMNTWKLLSRASLLGVMSIGFAGCIGEIGGEPDSMDSTEELTSECSQSVYNCKLPAKTIDRNRIYNYATKSYDWPIAAGAHLRDGLGASRGTVAGSSVRINYGARKTLDGQAHVYAFASKLTSGVTASGWVRELALKHGPIERMPTVKGKSPGHGDYQATWTVTGGNPSEFSGLKVTKGFSGSGRNATDYLKRPGNVVNLLYNLPGMGGVSIDTFPLGVKFKRSKNVSQLDVPLYHPGGSQVIRVMKFIYGHIGGRYGWIARDALLMDPAPASSPTPDPGPDPNSGSGSAPTGQCYVRCCDTTLHEVDTSDAPSCHEASQVVCSDRGYVKRSEFNGAEVYERPKFCYTKCKNRTKYHRVDGVTEDCTAHAKAYCAVGDRGAFEDALWSQCDP